MAGTHTVTLNFSEEAFECILELQKRLNKDHPEDVFQDAIFWLRVITEPGTTINGTPETFEKYGIPNESKE